MAILLSKPAVNLNLGGTTCDRRGSSTYTGTNPDGGTAKVFDPYNDVPPGGCDGQSDATWVVPLALQIIPALVLAIGMV